MLNFPKDNICILLLIHTAITIITTSTITTAPKAKTNTIISTAATTIAPKAKGIKAKNLCNIETVLN
jgi:hypothetical protein